MVRITNKGAPPCANCFADCFCQLFSYHPSNIYTMKVHVAWEHSIFKNMDLVAIQSSNPQAWRFNWQIFGKVWYSPLKSAEGYKKLKHKDTTLNLFCQWSRETLKMQLRYLLKMFQQPSRRHYGERVKCSQIHSGHYHKIYPVLSKYPSSFKHVYW